MSLRLAQIRLDTRSFVGQHRLQRYLAFIPSGPRRTVVTLRLTKKLLRLVDTPVLATEPSTTILGDWTGSLFYVGHARYVLLVSERARLPVLMPGRDLKNLARHFPGALAEVLLALGIPAPTVEREVEACENALIATTNNRSLLGTINDFAFLVSHQLREHPDADLTQAGLWLSRTPVGPLSHERPRDVARRLLV